MRQVLEENLFIYHPISKKFSKFEWKVFEIVCAMWAQAERDDGKGEVRFAWRLISENLGNHKTTKELKLKEAIEKVLFKFQKIKFKDSGVNFLELEVLEHKRFKVFILKKKPLVFAQAEREKKVIKFNQSFLEIYPHSKEFGKNILRILLKKILYEKKGRARLFSKEFLLDFNYIVDEMGFSYEEIEKKFPEGSRRKICNHRGKWAYKIRQVIFKALPFWDKAGIFRRFEITQKGIWIYL